MASDYNGNKQVTNYMDLTPIVYFIKYWH